MAALRGLLALTILLSALGNTIHVEAMTTDFPNDWTTTTPCGSGSLTADTNTQYLNSPYYPSSYPPNLYCSWDIVASPGYIINITVISMYTYSGDYLYIFEVLPSGVANQLARLAMWGMYYPESYNTSTSTARIAFSPISGMWGPGWQLTYTAEWTGVTTVPPTVVAPTTAEPACTGVSLTANLSVQYLSSPRFPSFYRDDMYCGWDIYASPGYAISITINTMNTEICCDYLYVLEVLSSGTTHQLASLSGNTVGKYRTSTSTARIVFVTDYSISYSGWMVSYKAMFIGFVGS